MKTCSNGFCSLLCQNGQFQIILTCLPQVLIEPSHFKEIFLWGRQDVFLVTPRLLLIVGKIRIQATCKIMGLGPRISLENGGKITHNGRLLIKWAVAREVSVIFWRSRDLLEVLKIWRSLDVKLKTTKREERIMVRKANEIALRRHRKIKQRCRLNMMRVPLLPLPEEDWERLVPTAANQVTVCTTSEQFFLTASVLVRCCAFGNEMSDCINISYEWRCLRNNLQFWSLNLYWLKETR